MREMAENAKEYGEDQCRKVQELEQELEDETKRRKGIEKELSETIDGWSAAGDKWDADMETMRILELDGLKQLEEVYESSLTRSVSDTERSGVEMLP